MPSKETVFIGLQDIGCKLSDFESGFNSLGYNNLTYYIINIMIFLIKKIWMIKILEV